MEFTFCGAIGSMPSHHHEPTFGAVGDRKHLHSSPGSTLSSISGIFGGYTAFDLVSCCSSEPGHSPSQTTTVTASPAPSLALRPTSPAIDALPADTPLRTAVVVDLAATNSTAFYEGVFAVLDAMVRQGARATSSFHKAKTAGDGAAAAPFYRRAAMAVIEAPLCSVEALLIALVLMARLQRVHSLSAVSPTTVRRVFACCAMIAAKLHDDVKSYAECFASASGTSLRMLLSTERQILSRLSYNTWVEPSEFAAVAEAVACAAARHDGAIAAPLCGQPSPLHSDEDASSATSSLDASVAATPATTPLATLRSRD